jgi:hypothetical protein
LQEAHVKLDRILQRASAENLQLMQNKSQKFTIARELDWRVDSMILESLIFSEDDSQGPQKKVKLGWTSLGRWFATPLLVQIIYNARERRWMGHF